MTQAAQPTEPQPRWWQWHLGDRMARHQHPGEALEDCSWPDCSWHGVRPGEDNLIASLPESAPRSVALGHLDGISTGEGGHFVYERDVVVAEASEDDFDFDYELIS